MSRIVSLASIPRSKFDKIKKKFKCSHEELEKHIKQFAYSHQKEGLYNTYFYVDGDAYLGYISIAIASIDREKIDDGVSVPASIKYEISALKITRLCTFENFQKKGAGTILMLFVKILATIQQKKIGCRAIIVDSKEEAVDFYSRFDYEAIAQQEDDNTIFMIHDLLPPKELAEYLDDMIEFCQQYGQDDIIPILKS